MAFCSINARGKENRFHEKPVSLLGTGCNEQPFHFRLMQARRICSS